MQLSRRATAAIITLLVVVPALGAIASAGHASATQESLIEDDLRLMYQNPAVLLAQFHRLGVDRVRLLVRWQYIAPAPNSRRRPARFRASDPASYPAATWATYDNIVQQAKKWDVGLDFDLAGGAPLWATGPHPPRDGTKHYDWSPSAREFGAFVHAIATRYSGNYDPKTRSLAPGNPLDLPAVRFWSIWNEPDYGPSLAPQGAPGHLTIERSPWSYRNLADAGWGAFQQTAHAHDTILFGELAPRGEPNAEQPRASFGVFSGMKPLVFLRALYCVDSKYRPLRGNAAAVRGCPTSAAGSRRFAAAHPVLFRATGFADHPYSRWYPPNVEAYWNPDYTSLAELGVLERGLDRLQRVYHSRKRFPIWDTEYGYITSPPKRASGARPWIGLDTAAYYLNWAEYISWRDPRVQSTAQYLLRDPVPRLASNDYGGFASGLLTFGGRPKPAYAAFRLPLYMPVTKAARGRSLEVWGAARPAPIADPVGHDPETVEIQLQSNSRGPFETVRTVSITNARGYFDVRVPFRSSGRVRLAWSYPPASYSPATTVYSRLVQITLHR
jgi:hypothetical protein